MSSDLIGLALLLDARSEERVVTLQRMIAEFFAPDPDFESGSSRPHVSLMQARGCPLDAFLSAGAELARRPSIHSPVADTARVALVPTPGWIFLDLTVSAFLRDCQDRALTTLSSRIDRRQTPVGNKSGYSPDELCSLRRYGYPYAGTAFRPHVTLTAIHRGNLEAARMATEKLSTGDLAPHAVTFSACSVFRVGPNGAFMSEIFRQSLRP